MVSIGHFLGCRAVAKCPGRQLQQKFVKFRKKSETNSQLTCTYIAELHK